MTYQPPPPPPPQGPPPPPPGGQWGPPPGNPYGAPRPGFDPKTVNPLDWAIIGAGVLAFVFSFVSYYSYSYSIAGFGGGTGDLNAWHGFFGWFAMLLALVGSAAVAIAIFAPQVKLPFAARLAGLVAYAVATLCVILAIFIVPDPYGVSGFDKGHGFGFWVSLIVIIAGLVASLMRFQQTGGTLPGALANMPTIGGHAGGPGGPGAPGAPMMPPPPPPATYGPPPGPPPTH
jgi:hypothetical protein